MHHHFRVGRASLTRPRWALRFLGKYTLPETQPVIALGAFFLLSLRTSHCIANSSSTSPFDTASPDRHRFPDCERMTPLDRRQNHPLPSGDVPTTRLCQRAVRLPTSRGEQTRLHHAVRGQPASDEGAALRRSHSYDEYHPRMAEAKKQRQIVVVAAATQSAGHHCDRTPSTSPARTIDGGVAPSIVFYVNSMTNKFSSGLGPDTRHRRMLTASCTARSHRDNLCSFAVRIPVHAHARASCFFRWGLPHALALASPFFEPCPHRTTLSLLSSIPAFSLATLPTMCWARKSSVMHDHIGKQHWPARSGGLLGAATTIARAHTTCKLREASKAEAAVPTSPVNKESATGPIVDRSSLRISSHQSKYTSTHCSGGEASGPPTRLK
mmetsp:Transcript_18952/g.58843  ORF Transcript_18952/g.58843 Transcript_18952/m.58843 type:complete len:382 (-) Transcript_18952:58-1203(-)